MTYKLNPILECITSPVTLVIDGKETIYSNGEEVSNLTLNLSYIIESISARDNSVVVMLKENDQQFNQNWIGEEAVSFV